MPLSHEFTVNASRYARVVAASAAAADASAEFQRVVREANEKVTAAVAELRDAIKDLRHEMLVTPAAEHLHPEDLAIARGISNTFVQREASLRKLSHLRALADEVYTVLHGKACPGAVFAYIQHTTSYVP
jgi:hypothetical protein